MTTSKYSGNMITVTDPDSAAAEAYRIIRTNITLRDVDNQLKIINVISSNAQESKSTTILNLAYVFSQINKKVLIIDMDLRLPSLHKKLKLKNKMGFSDVVNKKATFEEAVIHYSNKLDVLLSGSKNPYASEYILSKNCRMLLNFLRGQYDYIFIDCPPVNLVTDGIIASSFCDGTLLCIASGADDRKDLERTRDLLKQFKVNILGIVMTRVPVTRRYYSKYGGNYGYGYGYGYYNRDSKKKK